MYSSSAGNSCCYKFTEAEFALEKMETRAVQKKGVKRTSAETFR